MRASFGSKSCFVISVFLTFALFCAKPCFGANEGAGFGSFYGDGMSGMAVATTAVIGASAAAALILLSKPAKSESPAPVGGKPVILSKSDYNLLSIYQDAEPAFGEATPAMGKIHVQNKSGSTVRFDIPGAHEGIVVDPNSSCMHSVSPGGICTFDISYTLTGPVSVFASESVTIEIKGKTSDYITVNKISMPSNALYDPTVYDTKAHGIDIGAEARSFAKIDKDGVEFVYVGTSKGVFKTSDNGATWLAVNNGLTNKDVNTLHVVGDNLYAGAALPSADGGSNVFKSTNGGAAWEELDGTGLNNANINTLVSYGTKLCIGTDAGVYWRPIDGSGNWGLLGFNQQTPEVPVYALYSVDDGNYVGLYAGFNGVSGFVARYDSSSNDWYLIGEIPIPSAIKDVKSLLLKGNVLYAGVNLDVAGVYRIDLAVKNSAWEAFSTNLPANAKVSSLQYGDGDYLYAGVYASSGTGVYRFNTGGGAAWETYYAGMNKTVYTDNGLAKISAIYSTSSKIFTGFGFEAVDLGSVETLPIMTGGIYSRGFSDESWALLNNVLINKDVRALYMNNSELYAGTYGMGVFKSSDGGANWASVDYGNLGLGSKVQALTFWNNFMYAGTESNGVYELTDGSWVQKNTGLTNTAVHALGFWQKDGVASALYAATDDNSSNRGGLGKYSGSTWNMFKADPGQFYAMHDFGGDSNYLYVAGGVNPPTGGAVKVYKYDGVSGILSEMTNAGLPIDAYAYALHSLGDYLYVGTNGGGVYTVDPGTSNVWAKVGGVTLDNKIVEDLHPIGDYMFAAGNTPLSTGAISSNNVDVGEYAGGAVYYFYLAQWLELSTINLPEAGILGVYSLYSNDDDRLYAGTSNLGVLKAAFVPVIDTAAAK